MVVGTSGTYLYRGTRELLKPTAVASGRVKVLTPDGELVWDPAALNIQQVMTDHCYLEDYMIHAALSARSYGAAPSTYEFWTSGSGKRNLILYDYQFIAPGMVQDMLIIVLYNVGNDGRPRFFTAFAPGVEREACSLPTDLDLWRKIAWSKIAVEVAPLTALEKQIMHVDPSRPQPETPLLRFPGLGIDDAHKTYTIVGNRARRNEKQLVNFY